MAEARQSDEWDRAAILITILSNAYRDSEKRPQPWALTDWHPFLKKMPRTPMGIPLTCDAVHLFKGIFPPSKPKRCP